MLGWSPGAGVPAQIMRRTTTIQPGIQRQIIFYFKAAD